MDNNVTQLKYSDVFPQNSERVINQNNTPMMIIVGNPPYSIGQKVLMMTHKTKPILI